MKPILFKKDTVNFSSNGIGVLHDTISAIVIEERNGALGLDLEYPADGEWAKEIEDQKIIMAKPNDIDEPHAFRIFEVDSSLDDGILYVSANSITDDLGSNLIVNARVMDQPPQIALNSIKSGLIEPTRFNFVSDIETRTTADWVRVNPLRAIAGMEGSLVDLYGGEIKRTNNTLYLYSRRGRNKVTTIRPGKNISGFNMVVSTKGLITKMLPTFSYKYSPLEEYEMVTNSKGVRVKQTKYYDNKKRVEPKDVVVSGDVVSSPLANNYPIPFYNTVEFSSDEELSEKVDIFIANKEKQIAESPTVINTSGWEAELRAFVKTELDNRAARYFTYDNPGVDKPFVQVKVDMLQLTDSPEWELYDKLEHIQLTDTVDIYVKKFDVDVEVTISGIEYDALGEKVNKITAGSVKTTLSQAQGKEYQDETDRLKDYISSVENGVVNRILRTADGLNNMFNGYTEPPHDISSEGDIWFKIMGDGVIEIYIYDGGRWTAVINDAVFEELRQDVEQALLDAEEAFDRAVQAEAEAEASLNLAQEGFDKAQEALTSVNVIDQKAQDAFDAAQEAIGISAGVDQKAQDAFDLAQEAMLKSDGVDDKAQQALDDADQARIDAANALIEAQTSLSLAQQAMDNISGIDGMAQQAIADASTAKDTADEAILAAQEGFDLAQENATIIQGFGVRIEDNESNYTAISGTVDGLQTEVGAKVDTTTYNSKVTQLEGLINSKITEEEADGLYTKHSEFTQTVDSLQTDITTKVDGATYNSKMTQLDSLIASKISEADADGLYTKQSTFTQTVASLQSDISSKVDGVTYNSKMTQLDTAIGTKISEEDADGLYTKQSTFTQTVSAMQTEITSKVDTTTYNSKMTQLDTLISSKISETDADGLYTKQSVFTQTVGSLQSDISSKVDTTVYSSKMTQLDNAIQARITEADANSRFVNETVFTQSIDGISTRVGTIENWEIGGRNLLPAFTSESWSWNNKGTVTINDYTLEYEIGSNPQAMFVVELEPNTDYTMTFNSDYARYYIYEWINGTNGKMVRTVSEGSDVFTFNTGEITGYRVSINTWSQRTDRVRNIWNPKLEKGNKATDWSPAPEDVDAKFTAVNQTIDSIATRVQTTETNYSTLTQTVGGLQTEVNSKVATTTYNSKMTQLDTAITARITTATADGKYATKTALTATETSITLEVNKKVDTTTYNTKMTLLDNAIAARITTTAADGKYTAQTTFTATIDGINTEVNKKVDTTTYTSKMTQLDTAITARITTAAADGKYATTSALTLTTTSLTTLISSKLDTTTYTSKMTQLDNAINLRVTKNDVVNQLNIDNSGVLLSGSKIRLDGNVTVLGTFKVSDANISSLSASKITTGTLDASKATITNINASNINSGTMATGRISTLILTGISNPIIYFGSNTSPNGWINFASNSLRFQRDTWTYYRVNAGGANPNSNVLHQFMAGGNVIFNMGTSSTGHTMINSNNSGIKFSSTLSEIQFRNGSDTGYQNIRANNINGADLEIRAIFSKYNTARRMLYDHNNGNTSVNAVGGSLYLGYEQTSRVYVSTTLDTQTSDIVTRNLSMESTITASAANLILRTNVSSSLVYLQMNQEARVTTPNAGSYRPIRASSFPTASLEKWKTDITEWNGSALDLINQSTIYNYRLKDEVEEGKDRYRQGLVIGSDYNTPDEIIDGDGVEQYLMNSWSWKAIQELDEKNNSVNKKVSSLFEENELMRNTINELILKVSKLEETV